MIVDEDGTDATIWSTRTKGLLNAVPMTELLDVERELAYSSSAKSLGQLLWIGSKPNSWVGTGTTAPAAAKDKRRIIVSSEHHTRISTAATASTEDELPDDDNDVEDDVRSRSGRKKDVDDADDSWSPNNKSLYSSVDGGGDLEFSPASRSQYVLSACAVTESVFSIEENSNAS